MAEKTVPAALRRKVLRVLFISLLLDLVRPISITTTDAHN